MRIASFITFFIFALSLQGQSLLCANLFPIKWVKSTITFTPEQHKAHFWEIHKRFGFLKTDDNKTLLVATDREVARSILHELATAFNTDPTYFNELNFVENRIIAQSITVDVSNILPKNIQDLLLQHPNRNGPNCWNLCLVNSQAISGLRFSSADEFSHWVNSSFVKKIDSPNDLKPNDIISFHRKTKEVHGAIYISPEVVLSKNGFRNSTPYMLMDIRELNEEYGQESPFAAELRLKLKPKTVSYFRLRSIKEIAALMPNGIPEQLDKALKDFSEVENQFQKSFFNILNAEETSLLRQQINNLSQKYLEIIHDQIENLKGARSRQHRSELHLWKALKLRLENLPKAP